MVLESASPTNIVDTLKDGFEKHYRLLRRFETLLQSESVRVGLEMPLLMDLADRAYLPLAHLLAVSFSLTYGRERDEARRGSHPKRRPVVSKVSTSIF